jgi:hypothetical protein
MHEAMSSVGQVKRKVFCIGMHKTGTTSLGRALELLDYRVCGPVGYRKPDIAQTLWETARELIDDYDSFHNNPWALLYRELDQHAPGSRFVLTVRPGKDWYASMLKHFGAERTPMRELIYGTGMGAPLDNEALYLARYERHNASVVEYFAGRDDLLAVDLTAGDGWNTLCPFLGVDVPPVPFPYLNRTPDSPRAGAMTRDEVIRLHGHLIGGLPYGKVKS